MRSTEGGASDQRIGSWFGVILSLSLVTGIFYYLLDNITAMNNFREIKYSSIEIKNDSDDQEYDTLISNFTFFPSIHINLFQQTQFDKSQEIAEVFEFD